MKVLLLEDDPSIQATVTFALRKAGHVPLAAFTLAQARTILATYAPDFAVLDVVLPDGDGFAFAHELRATSNAPIIFLTSRSAESDRIAGLRLGADDYVAKPFSLDELLLRITAVARRTRHSQARSAVGNPPLTSTAPSSRLSVDDASHTCTVDGRLVDLTASEFDLLGVFLRHRHQVCSREFLLDHLNRDNADKTDRSIDAHVKRLRRKFQSHGVDPIRTVRGVGYQYESP